MRKICGGQEGWETLTLQLGLKQMLTLGKYAACVKMLDDSCRPGICTC